MIRDVGFYQQHPVEWLEDFGGSKFWYAQKEILDSVAQNNRTTVKSGHGIGKSYTAAGIVLWFLLNFPPPCIVVTTAPTKKLVKEILWSEIADLHAKLKKRIEGMGELLQTYLRFTHPRHYGIGFTTDDPHSFQGIHAQHMLTIFDEACGIPPQIYESAKSLTSAAGNKVLLIGNPTEPNTYFHHTFTGKVSGYHKITVSSTQSPNVREREDGLYEDVMPIPYPGLVGADWINEMILTHGRNSNVCKGRVFGEFPTSAEDQLIDGRHVALAIMKGAQLRGLLERLTDGDMVIRSEDIKRIRGI